MEKLSSRDEQINIWIIFFLWPFAALISSIKNYRSHWAKNGLWLFVIFFGFTIIPKIGSDSTRYIAWLHHFHNANNDFATFSRMLYAEDSRYIDIFQPLITFIVALFTDDHRVLFSIFAFIFGFFYSRNIWYLLDLAKGKLNLHLKILIILFALLVPFWFINTVRFWTAAHIFFYGAFPFLIEGDHKRLIISALSIFVHFSFVFPVAVLLLYILLGNRKIVFLAFFILTSLISEVEVSSFRNIMIAYTPVFFHQKVNAYTNEERMEMLKEKATKLNWYAVWHEKSLNISLKILLVIIYFAGKEVWKKRKDSLRLFSFLLLFYGFANLFSFVSSGGRFYTLANLFSVAFIFLYFYYNRYDNLAKHIFNFMIPFIGFFLLVNIRIGFDFIGLNTILTNPITALFFQNEISLINIIK